MRYVAYDGNGTVMLVAANGYDARAKGAERLVELEKRLVLSLPLGTQNPIRALEEVGTRGTKPVCLGTGHGVTGEIAVGMGQDVVRVARDDRLRRGDVGNDAIVSAGLEALEPITCGMHGRRYDNEVAFSTREPFVHTGIIDESVLVERTLLPRFLEWLGMASDADDDGRVVKLLHGRGDRSADEAHADDDDPFEWYCHESY